jgi:hypothetical protein
VAVLAQHPLHRETKPRVAHLNEYRGDVAALADDAAYTIYLVSNADLDEEDRASLLAMSETKREACLRKEVGAPLKVRYATREPVWAFFAIRNRTSSKRAAAESDSEAEAKRARVA